MRISKTLLYLIILVFSSSLFIYLDLKNTSILYDDAYSVFMIKASYSDIALITASDVHPPLYYWGLKTYSLIFGDSIFALRIFSFLGIFFVLLLGCFPVRRMFGHEVAISFLILITIFPVTQYLISDIRMYSWAMFFVLVCGLFAYKVFENGRVKDWSIFFFSGIAAAYIHNYGLLSILGIYLILFICLFTKKKSWIKLLVCGLVFVLAYSPWLFQLIGQIDHVSKDYWIKPLNISDLFLHIYYFYSPKEVWLPFSHFTKWQMMIGLILLMAIQLILTLKVLLSVGWKDQLVRLGVYSFCAFLFPIFLGALISILYVPVLVTRYMTCSFGLFVLSTAFFIAKIYGYPKFRKLLCLFLFLLFIDASLRVYSGVKYYDEMEVANENIRQFVKGTKTFVVNDFSYHVMPRLELIAPGHEYNILKSKSDAETFSPFIFNVIESDSFHEEEFILVHQERQTIQSDFRTFQTSLTDHYIVTDSIHASDIYLYRMKKLDIIN